MLTRGVAHEDEATPLAECTDPADARVHGLAPADALEDHVAAGAARGSTHRGRDSRGVGGIDGDVGAELPGLGAALLRPCDGDDLGAAVLEQLHEPEAHAVDAVHRHPVARRHPGQAAGMHGSRHSASDGCRGLE